VNASSSVAPVTPSEPTSPSVTSFEQLDLSPTIQAALRAVRYLAPTPIQAATIAPALAGRDVIGAAQTGTGKTAAFMIPIVERLRANGSGARGSAVILAPTRELAEQIHGWAQRLGSGLKTALVVGGVAYGPQMGALRARPAIIVATPGRLVDHLERKTLALADVRIFVLDEADRMLDMGFKPQLDKIMRGLPAERQTLLFSATMPPDLGALARMHLRNPVRVAVGAQAVPPPKATQDVYLVGNGEKTPLLLTMVATNPGNVLVFARTKHRTDRVMRSLCDAGFAAQRLHSNRSQQQRREALECFRRGRYRILVATDIAARGIDVADIRHVINYDLPQTAEDYVHRVGRTARAEAEGRATSFASPEERDQLRAIERHIGKALPRQSTPHGTRDPRTTETARHRTPRPVEAVATHRSRTFRTAHADGATTPPPRRHPGSFRQGPTARPITLADFAADGQPPSARPSAQARRSRRGRHS
jgi:ATP-dependent RNA helicase RhlE